MSLSDRDVLDYAQRRGASGRKMLSILGKNQQFINALDHPAGRELVKYLFKVCESNRIAYDEMDIDNSKAKFIEARAKYKESERILFHILEVIDKQEKELNKIKEDVNGR